MEAILSDMVEKVGSPYLKNMVSTPNLLWQTPLEVWKVREQLINFALFQWRRQDFHRLFVIGMKVLLLLVRY